MLLYLRGLLKMTISQVYLNNLDGIQIFFQYLWVSCNVLVSLGFLSRKFVKYYDSLPSLVKTIIHGKFVLKSCIQNSVGWKI